MKKTLFCLLILIHAKIGIANKVNDGYLLKTLTSNIIISDSIKKTLNDLKSQNNIENVLLKNETKILLPLYKQYPGLMKLPYISFADLPTPIERCENLSKNLGNVQIFIKRDDLTGKKINEKKLLGGNKVRKLEFLLGDALINNAQTVITTGMSGSNHALSTAIYAHELGLKSISLLVPQWNSKNLQRNLLLSYYYNADLHLYPNREMRNLGAINLFLDHKQKFGSFPYYIPVGGSCPLGVVGYVNAAFELKEQLEKGMMPTPDRIYLATGSFGTLVGLIIGLKAADLKIPITAIAIEPEEFPGQIYQDIESLFKKTIEFLNFNDANFPAFILDKKDFDLIHDFAGQDYGLFTKEAIEAIKLMNEKENIKLDGTYTGKAFSAIIYDARNNKLNDKTILFWNTYCGELFEDLTKQVDYKNLPICFREYFETSIQEINCIK